MSVASEKFSLPPNVAGKVRAYLDITIERVDWKTSKTFSDVKIKLLWWGQKEAISCEGIKININKKLKIPSEPLRTIRYNINTNNRLFQSYLKHCESLKIEFFSTKTGDFIGESDIKIPLRLQNFTEGTELSCKVTSPILSSRLFNLGDMVLSISIQQAEKMTQKTSSNTQSTKTFKEETQKKVVSKINECKVLKEKNFNKENIQVIGTKKKVSFRDPKPVKQSSLVKGPRKEKPKPKVSKESDSVKSSSRPSSSVSSSTPSEQTLSTSLSEVTHDHETSSLINYLSGATMSRLDEANVLNKLATISPTSSIIEGLNRVKIQPSKPESKTKLADKINSIRIVVSQIEFNNAGQLEAQSYINKTRQQKFIMKCVITSKSFKSNEDVKILSPVFENAPQRIFFGNEVTQRIVFNQIKKSVFINFGYCMKPIDQHMSPFFVGFSRVDLTEVVNSKGAFHKKCPIISESDMKIGTMTLRMELGINELHFGRHLIDSLYNGRDNISINSDDSMPRQIIQQKRVKLVDQNVQTTACPSHSNDQCESDRNFESKNVQTDKTSSEQVNKQVITRDGLDDKDTEMVNLAMERNPVRSKVYQGLLFIEALRNVKDQSEAEYFITYEGFWNECQESTELSINYVFNHIKQFPVICDDSFLKRVQNNHLELKLWEKTDRSEKWIGSSRVPLHQFFIAFRDIAMIEHLSSNQLPIISIDTWSNFVSPLSSELFCQGKVLLAIGNENQIEYLKMSRNLHNLPMPVKRKLIAPPVKDSFKVPAVPAIPDASSQIKNKLTAFIESLSQKLPETTTLNNFHKTASAVSSISTPPSSAGQPQLRKTSELLESLQKALSKSPEVSAMEFQESTSPNHRSHESDSSMNSFLQEKIRMVITIDHASHLPKVVKKKQNRRKNKTSTTPQKAEFEPSAYVTFESCLEHMSASRLPENVVKSHEGFVHCTKVVKSCDPQWNESFETEVMLDVLTNPQKRFVVKVWRKVAQDSEPRAAPFEDAVIGFSAIDLSVLLTGLPILSGYYNIMDFSGRCNGQIKLSVKPCVNLVQYQDSSASLPVVAPLMNPLSIEISGSDDSGSTLLSRTLKRKFTELDEITQRLKARLFDVTGDENFDPDDEFERDLNTAVDEMEDDDNQDFSWLKSNSNGNDCEEPVNELQSQLNKILEPQPSTSKSSQESLSSKTQEGQRTVSGCSNYIPQPLAIDQLLKKYDLDTLINPNIFKNILDPTLANSDSTPTLNPHPVNTNSLANVSGESGDTTVSSILSNDQVQTIQKALQKASIGDASDQSSSRKDPDGENNISE